MIEELNKNIETEISILREVSSYIKRIETVKDEYEKNMLSDAINSLTQNLKLINNSIPAILKEVSLAKPLTNIQATNLEKITYKSSISSMEVTMVPRDREKFLQELSISEALIKKLRKKVTIEKEKNEEFKASRGYLRLSNKFFLETSSSFVKKGYFRPLAIDLKKANIDILFEAYVAMMFLTSFLSIFAGIIIASILLFFNVGITAPFLIPYSGNLLIRALQVVWIPFVTPVLVFVSLYWYPSTEKASLEKRIDQEIPFAVIHMSAISGSGIEPTQIFRIIGLSKEYPFLRKEIRKVLNQINIYGYDLVTALNNTSKSTPSNKLAELFAGLSTVISSGGSLKEFFEKRSETLLVAYRLEREKYTKLAETFMDMYISIVIAAPMILMLLLIMITVSGFSTGLSPQLVTILIVLAIALINVVFITFIHIKQPSY